MLWAVVVSGQIRTSWWALLLSRKINKYLEEIMKLIVDLEHSTFTRNISKYCQTSPKNQK